MYRYYIYNYLYSIEFGILNSDVTDSCSVYTQLRLAVNSQVDKSGRATARHWL